MLRNRVTSRKWIFFAVSILAGFSALVVINSLLVMHLGAGSAFFETYEKYVSLFQDGVSPYDYRPDSPLIEPLYGFLLYLPYMLFGNKVFAASIWLATNQTAFVLTILLTGNLFSWKPNRLKITLSVIFFMAFFYTCVILFQGQSTIMRLFLLMCVCWSIIKNHQEFSGILIAFLTISPITNIHLIVFFLFWAAANKRGRIFVWFFISTVILIAVGLLVQPEWPLQWLKQMLIISNQPNGHTITAILTGYWSAIGTRLGTALTVLTLSLMLIEWWVNRRSNGRAFMWIFSLTIIIGAWIGVPTHIDEMVFAIVPIMVFFIIVGERWKRIGTILSVCVGSILLILPWIVFFLREEHSLSEPISNPVHIISIPLIIIPFLYWIRWWCLNPPEMWFDYIRKITKMGLKDKR